MCRYRGITEGASFSGNVTLCERYECQSLGKKMRAEAVAGRTMHILAGLLQISIDFLDDAFMSCTNLYNYLQSNRSVNC